MSGPDVRFERGQLSLPGAYLIIKATQLAIKLAYFLFDLGSPSLRFGKTLSYLRDLLARSGQIAPDNPLAAAEGVQSVSQAVDRVVSVR